MMFILLVMSKTKSPCYDMLITYTCKLMCFFLDNFKAYSSAFTLKHSALSAVPFFMIHITYACPKFMLQRLSVPL